MEFEIGIPQELLGLVAALAIGLLIGLERGWRGRALPQGGRTAGLRTFAITGLFGGILASLPDGVRVWAISAGLLSIATFMAIAYWRETAAGSQGMTTAITLLLTFALGAYAAVDHPLPALGVAVIIALLLNLKETLHGWLRKIEPQELRAGLQLLVLSVVVLPTLPNRNLGPYDSLNPYQLWWAVILIATLSMVGHIAMRVFGANRGILWTGLLGGLASSTATTLALARLAKQTPSLVRPSIASALSATGMMTIRLALILSVLQTRLFVALAPALFAAAFALFLPFIWEYRRALTARIPTDLPKNIRPYSLQTALLFGLFLAVIEITVPFAKDWLGNKGVLALAALSGLADVDAITISLATIFGSGTLSLKMASLGIAVAIVVNMGSKLAISAVAGTTNLFRYIALGYLAALCTGGFILALLLY